MPDTVKKRANDRMNAYRHSKDRLPSWEVAHTAGPHIRNNRVGSATDTENAPRLINIRDSTTLTLIDIYYRII
jgi:hypothetical protein